MTTLIEKSILNERLEKSRSGTYADTSENRRKHRVGQKYGSEKKEEEKPEKTSFNEKDPAKELEAVDKVIAAINEGKLKLPQEEIMVLVEKKNNLELEKRQAEKIHSGVKANEEKRNAAEVKETSKKINEATKEAKDEGKQYASMDIKEAKKELVGKKITFKEYFFDGIDSYKDAEGEIKKVRLYGKEKQPIAEIDFPNGDGITILLEQLDKRQAAQFKIEFNDSKPEDSKPEPKQGASGADKKEEREYRKKMDERTKEVNSSEVVVSEAKSALKEAFGKLSYRDEGGDEIVAEAGEGRANEQLGDFGLLIDKKTGKVTLYNAVDGDDIMTGFPTNQVFVRKMKESMGFKASESTLESSKADPEPEAKEEESSEEAKESYTRVKFDDVPNSGKVNLKKYLSEKVRKGVDEKWSNIKNIPTDNLKKMEKGLVNDLNKNFEAIKKSQRAELLYSIMKVKGELEKRGKESQKKE